jgi:hypothetical protein
LRRIVFGSREAVIPGNPIEALFADRYHALGPSSSTEEVNAESFARRQRNQNAGEDRKMGDKKMFLPSRRSRRVPQSFFRERK